ncbi:hypothetical protein LV716_16410 [Flagellimonas sp. HMM57]|uniref:hypothetical protein n=1 Tax=unclassified Flagellimonas TaxID=2644544 RepID=UPI0013D53593|nr:MULTISPECIES: hypothetical protein [unclassified Flagellimonas]UII75825.1 hypothetical protein LV716_16410 [Flagellimonas sp. HMM57]
MKNSFIILLLLYFLIGCKNEEFTHRETVTKYYTARNASDFDALRVLLSDSLTTVSGDYVMPYDHDSFYEVFKWDSIFGTSYKLIELEEKDNKAIAMVTLNSDRLKFLKNGPMTCQYQISFESGKISKIEELECKDADWDIWRKQVDSLVVWVNRNHPELNGFIHDMTMNGAKDYLKAIKLYKADKNAL